MIKVVIVVYVSLAVSLFGAYNIGDTVRSGDNISWTDNYGYSSNIFNEVAIGKPVMIFFGGFG
jgi:hypothetical protein